MKKKSNEIEIWVLWCLVHVQAHLNKLGLNLSKRSPYKVLSTYTVNEHTFQKAKISQKMFFFIGLIYFYSYEVF